MSFWLDFRFSLYTNLLNISFLFHFLLPLIHNTSNFFQSIEPAKRCTGFSCVPNILPWIYLINSSNSLLLLTFLSSSLFSSFYYFHLNFIILSSFSLIYPYSKFYPTCPFRQVISPSHLLSMMLAPTTLANISQWFFSGARPHVVHGFIKNKIYNITFKSTFLKGTF